MLKDAYKENICMIKLTQFTFKAALPIHHLCIDSKINIESEFDDFLSET